MGNNMVSGVIYVGYEFCAIDPLFTLPQSNFASLLPHPHSFCRHFQLMGQQHTGKDGDDDGVAHDQ